MNAHGQRTQSVGEEPGQIQMLEVRNNTPFKAVLVPALDQLRRNFAVVIIKATFDIVRDQAPPVIAEEQVEIAHADEFHGEPDSSSVRYESDLAWVKRGVDIVLNGHVYAPGGRRAIRVDSHLQVGSHRHSVAVFGDRHWEKRGLQWQMSHPQPFERVALRYEYAYGGVARTAQGESIEYFSRNPLGKGFPGGSGRGIYDGMPLPNLENPTRPIRHWDDAQEPVGFGFIGRSWQPRIGYAGTYDDAWQRDQMPLLPEDFDERYHSGAHPDLVLPLGGVAGSLVSLRNLSESGSLSFVMPNISLEIAAKLKGRSSAFMPFMDTVFIEPDSKQVVVVWRAAIPCKNQLLYLDEVAVNAVLERS